MKQGWGLMEYKRGSNTKVSKFFNSNEFDCHCGQCDTTLIDPLLVLRLDILREALGAAIVILSGYRCALRQQQIKEQGLETAKGISTHEQGKAADIYSRGFSGSHLAFKAKESNFKRIGEAFNWIHVDVKDGEAHWFYKGAET